MNYKIDSKKLYLLIVDLCIINTWLSEMTLISEFYASVKNIVLILIVLGIVIEILCSKFRTGQLLIILCLFCLCIYSYYLSGVAWVMYLFFSVCFAWKIDDVHDYLKNIHRLFSVILLVNCLTFFIQYFFARSTLVVITTRNMLRYTINFSSSADAVKFFIFYALLILMIKERYTMKNILALILGSGIFYYFTHSETILFIPVIIMLDLLRNNMSIKKAIKFLGKWLFPACAAVTILGIMFWQTGIFSFLDNLLTGRVSMSRQAYELYSYTILGQFTELSQWLVLNNGKYQFLYVDSSYMRFIVNYGFIYLFPITIIVMVSNKYLNYVQRIGIIIFSLIGIVISSMISPLSIFPLVIAANQLWKIFLNTSGNAAGTQALRGELKDTG